MTTPEHEHSVPIPASHLDLLTERVHGVLTTVAPTGQPRSSLVWVDHDGSCARINTTLPNAVRVKRSKGDRKGATAQTT